MGRITVLLLPLGLATCLTFSQATFAQNTKLTRSVRPEKFLEGIFVGEDAKALTADGKWSRFNLRKAELNGKKLSHGTWNVFCFLIVKDMWRRIGTSEKIAGQSNICIELKSFKAIKIVKETTFVTGSKPYEGKGPVPPAIAPFRKQVLDALSKIAAERMNIPDNDFEAVQIQLAVARDPHEIPRYPTPGIKEFFIRKVSNEPAKRGRL